MTFNQNFLPFSSDSINDKNITTTTTTIPVIKKIERKRSFYLEQEIFLKKGLTI